MNPISAPQRSLVPLLVLVLLFLACASVYQAIGQHAQSQAETASQLKPVSLPHLYWHFLIHQSDLDGIASKLTAQGGLTLRNDLQTNLGFSDADYAPIRTSSQRLAAELDPIEGQLKSLRNSPERASQAQALIAQRESYINNEVYNLSIELSAQNKALLEKFMTTFFAPENISAAVPATSVGKAAQK
jgi:hypothetical protein